MSLFTGRGCALLAVLLLGGCLAPLRETYPDWRRERPTEPTPVDPVLVHDFGEEPFHEAQLADWAAQDRLLLMVPGVDVETVATRQNFLDEVRTLGGYARAGYYDWHSGHLGRSILLAQTTESAGRRLLELCRSLGERNPRLRIDLIAHSGGSVVVLKAALGLAETESPLRLGHVLLLGTPIQPDQDVRALVGRCQAVINVHSDYDQVTRQLSDADHGLQGLPETATHRNVRFDRSLGGLRVRHQEPLVAGPELRLFWTLILRDGRLPSPLPNLPDTEPSLEELHRHALWLAAEGEADPVATLALIARLCSDSQRERQCYGVILATVRSDPQAWPAIKPLLQDPSTPPWLRRQVHRYLVALQDGRYIDLLRWCRKRDPVNAETTRDALHDLDRADIAPVRDGTGP